MPCDTRLKRNYRRLGRVQTISERKAEVKKAVDTIAEQIVRGDVKAVNGPGGAVALQPKTEAARVALEAARDGVTDACVVRQIMLHGSAFQKLELQKHARVNMQALATGGHSHDHGGTWHKHH